MSTSTKFKLLFSNLDYSKRISDEAVNDLALINFDRCGLYSFKNDDEKIKRYNELGKPMFLKKVEKTKVKSYDGKHEYESWEQVVDPLPIWINTENNHVYYEMLSYEFLSDFDNLYSYYNLTGQGKNECVEITKEDAQNILQAIDYIFLGKYDKDLERIFLDGNRFISILEDVYPKFTWRFRKTRDKDSNKTIVILKEKNSEYSNETDDCYNEDYEDYGDSESEWEYDGRITLERLRTVMESFLHLVDEYRYSEKPFDIKLIYLLSI